MNTAVVLLALLVFGCGSAGGAECAPLVREGSRCVCPAGAIPIDDWTCELPDGGSLVRDGRPDSGLDSSVTPQDGGPVLDGGDDAGAPDGGSDAAIDAPVSPPDLLIACMTPPSVVGMGDDVAVEYEVLNLGSESARDFVVRLVAPAGSRLGVGGAPATLTEERVLLLSGGGSRMGTLRFVVPARIANGDSPMDCLVDADDAVPESDETNNADRKLLTATGRAALSVEGTIPASLTEGLRLDFTITNSGPVTSPEVQWQFNGEIGGSAFTMDGCETNVDCPILGPGQTARVRPYAAIPTGGGTGTATFAAGSAIVSRSGVTYVP